MMLLKAKGIKIKRQPSRMWELWETRSVFQGLVGNRVVVVHQPGSFHRSPAGSADLGDDREDLFRDQFVLAIARCEDQFRDS
jgi:hypothetical protein